MSHAQQNNQVAKDFAAVVQANHYQIVLTIDVNDSFRAADMKKSRTAFK